MTDVESTYAINNCAVIYEKDNDFGVVETVKKPQEIIVLPENRT